MVEQFELQRRKDRGKMLMNFCKQNDLVVMIACFKKWKTKLCTQKSARDWKSYQIDYIEKPGFKNSIQDIKTIPRVDTDSDHNRLVAKVQTRLKSIKKAGKRKLKWNLEKKNQE